MFFFRNFQATKSNGNGVSRSTIVAEDVEMGDNGSASLYPQDTKPVRVFVSTPSDWVILGTIIDRACLFFYIGTIIFNIIQYDVIL